MASGSGWYIAQSLLLLLASYFIGAWLGCVIRRSAFPGTLAARGGHLADVRPIVAGSAVAGAAVAAAGAVRAPERWPEVAPVAAETAVAVERFERALTGDEPAPPASAGASGTSVPLPVVRPIEPLLPRIETITEPSPPAVVEPAPVVDAPPAMTEPVFVPEPLPAASYKPEPLPAAEPPAPTVEAWTDIPGGAAASAAALAAAAATGQYTGERELPGSEPYVLPEPARATEAVSERIEPLAAMPSTVDLPNAASRAAAAAATAAAVVTAGIAASQAAPGRVVYPATSGGGWSTPFPSDAVPATDVPATTELPAAPEPAAGPIAPSEPIDVFTRIRGIDKATASTLVDLGVRRFADIASWDADDVRYVNDELGADGRVERENWIEQAQILARGGVTHFAAQEDHGDAPLAVPGTDEGAPVEPPLADYRGVGGDIAAVAAAGAGLAAVAAFTPAAEPETVASRAAFSGATPAPQPATINDRGDLLTRIYGINPEIERMLNEHGVRRFRQMAEWSQTDVERFDHLLGSGGRIARENWIGQARALASLDGDAPSPLSAIAPVTMIDRVTTRSEPSPVAAVPADEQPDGADTATPPATVVAPTRSEEPTTEATSAPRSDLAGLRSVRSEALRGTDDPTRPAMDDLKRIRGVGVLVEKKLNALGVSSYEQVANWSAEDVERVSSVLDFRGRIERENWIEQARILSSGGDTEFSRRVDRGEVESSRTKPQD